MTATERFSKRVREFADRIHGADIGALSGLYDLTANRLLRLAVTITRNQHDAEDAVQATLVRVADAPRFLSAADAAWPYLLRMVRNESLIILRRRKLAAVTCTELTDLVTHVAVDEVQREETFRAVWTALRALPVDQSEVVVLKVWEELTFAQIGEVLEISPATAASRYRYALEKLSRKLGTSEVCCEPT